MASSESETRLSVGDSVVDSEDDDPDEAIVIERPSGQAISEWAHDTESGTATVAATNPDYPADDQLIVVVFRSALNESVPDWQAADPDSLSANAADAGVTEYGFPERRLEPVEPGAVAARWLDGLADRLTDAGWDVTHDATELSVEQFDESYRITADGDVHGDSEYRTPLENLVAMAQP